jgi:catalase
MSLKICVRAKRLTICFSSYPEKVSGMKQRLRGTKFSEHFNQATLFVNSLARHERKHLANAIAFELSHCDDPVVYNTYTKLLNNINFNLAKDVATVVGGVVPDAPAKEYHTKASPTLSQTHFDPKKPTITSRRIAILVADGFNFAEMEAVRAALASAKASTFIVGCRRGKIYSSGEAAGVGDGIMADHHLEGQRSTLFDAIFIPSGLDHVTALASNGRAVHWIREAFGHCKAIGAIGEGWFISGSPSYIRSDSRLNSCTTCAPSSRFV